MTYYTVFAIDLASRRVQIVGSTPFPNDLFMRQVGRTLTTADEGLLVRHRVLIYQGLENELITGAPVMDEQVGRIRRRPRLGGLLNYYCRAA